MGACSAHSVIHIVPKLMSHLLHLRGFGESKEMSRPRCLAGLGFERFNGCACLCREIKVICVGHTLGRLHPSRRLLSGERRWNSVW